MGVCVLDQYCAPHRLLALPNDLAKPCSAVPYFISEYTVHYALAVQYHMWI